MRLTKRGWAAVALVCLAIALAWVFGERSLNAVAAPTLTALVVAGVAVVAVASPVALGATVLPDPISVTALVAAPFLAWGTLWYTRRRSPLPTVTAMLVVLIAQVLVWLLV